MSSIILFNNKTVFPLYAKINEDILSSAVLPTNDPNINVVTIIKQNINDNIIENFLFSTPF